jgi:hypothetical protein
MHRIGACTGGVEMTVELFVVQMILAHFRHHDTPFTDHHLDGGQTGSCMSPGATHLVIVPIYTEVKPGAHCGAGYLTMNPSATTRRMTKNAQ